MVLWSWSQILSDRDEVTAGTSHLHERIGDFSSGFAEAEDESLKVNAHS